VAESRVAELTAELETATASFAGVTAALESKEAELASLAAETERAAAEVEATKKAHADAAAESGDATVMLEERVGELEAALQSKTKEAETATAESAELATALERKSTEVEERVATIKKAKGIIAKLKEGLAAEKEAAAAATVKVEELQKEVEATKSVVADGDAASKAELLTAIAANTELEERIAVLTTELETATSEVATMVELRAALSSKEAEVDKLNITNSTFEEERALDMAAKETAQKALEAASSSSQESIGALEGEVKELQEALETETAAAEQVRGQMSTTVQRFTSLQEKSRGLVERETAAIADLKTKEEECEELRGSLAVEKTRGGQYKAKLQEAASSFKKLKEQTQILKETRIEAAARLESLEKEKEAMKEGQHEGTRHLEEALEVERAAAKAKAEAVLIMQGELGAKEAELTNAQNALREATEEKEAANRARTEAEAGQEGHAGEAESVRAELEKYKVRAHTALRNAKAEQQAAVDALVEELTTARGEVETATVAAAAAASDTMSVVRGMEARNEALGEEVEQARLSVRAKQDELATTTAAAEKRVAELEETLGTQLEAVRGTNETLRGRIGDLEASIDGAKSREARMKEEVDDMRLKIQARGIGGGEERTRRRITASRVANEVTPSWEAWSRRGPRRASPRWRMMQTTWGKELQRR
jgi:chromosome segregation ATPase